MEWYVYVENFNAQKIEEYNIFNHYSFAKDCKEAFNKCENKKQFAESVKSRLMYYFWCKCEWEIILSEWPPKEDKPMDRKVDVYSQVMLNFDKFIDYLWDCLNERYQISPFV